MDQAIHGNIGLCFDLGGLVISAAAREFTQTSFPRSATCFQLLLVCILQGGKWQVIDLIGGGGWTRT